MAAAAGLLLALAAVAVLIPRLLTIPVAVVAAWVGVTLLVRAWRLRAGADLPATGVTNTGFSNSEPSGG